MDSEYLKQHVGSALSAGLSEVCQRKPVDPIEYLAKWLRKYVENVKHEQQDKDDVIKLAKEKEQAAEERRLQQAMLEEQNQIANEIKKREIEQNANDFTGSPKEDHVENSPIPQINMTSSETQMEKEEDNELTDSLDAS